MVWVKKSTGKNPGYHPYTNEDMKRVSWCIDRRIKIAVIPSGTKWKIDIVVNNKKHTDPSSYDDDVVYNKVNEYYKYYYDKHNKQ